MKTMKFFMLASAFASMIGFSSCLNGETNTTIQGAPILKVESSFMGGTYFTDISGVKYIPNKEILSAEGKFAYVPMQYDYSLYNQQENSYDITLLGDLSYLRTVTANYIEIPQEQTTATLDVVDDGYNAGLVWGANNEYLLLPLSYTLHKDVDRNDEDEMNEELRKHNFIIYTIPGKEFSENGDSLKLYLRYTIQGVDLSEENAAKKYSEEYTSKYADYRYLQLNIPGSGNPKWIRLEFEKSNNYNGATIAPNEKTREVRSYQLYQKK